MIGFDNVFHCLIFINSLLRQSVVLRIVKKIIKLTVNSTHRLAELIINSYKIIYKTE